MKRFPKKFIADRIRFENSWWKTAKADKYYQKMKHRAFFSLFFNLLEKKRDKRSILMLGTRRVGKTTLIFQAIQKLIDIKVKPTNIVYLSLENPIYYAYSLNEILQIVFHKNTDALKQRYYVFLDEIQYYIAWEKEIVALVLSFPNVKFIFSGSVFNFQELNIKDNKQYFIHFRLPTLTFYEYVNFIHTEDFFDCDEASENCDLSILDNFFKDYLKFGGHPELILTKKPYTEASRLFRNKILNQFTVKTFPNLIGIDSIPQINVFIAYLIFNTGREISYEVIKQETELSNKEIVEYLGFLKTIFFIRILWPFNSPQSSVFKIYITNPSYIYAIFDYNNITNYMDNNRLIETAILAQWEHLESNFFYHKDAKNNISFLKSDTSGNLEWCTTVNYSGNQIMDMEAFILFCNKNNIYFPVFATQNSFKTLEKNGTLISQQPASLYCYQVGRHIIETELT